MSAADLDRRAFLRTGAGALITVAGLPAALGGCGGGRARGAHEQAVARRSIGIDYASYYPPVMHVHRLALRRAAQVGAQITFSRDPSGAPAQQANLRRWTSDRGGFGAVVVAPFDVAAVKDVVSEAGSHDVSVVSYLTPVPGADAAIAVDAALAGVLLARATASWASREIGGQGDLLLVRPAAAPAVPDPFAPLARPAERALRRELARRAPGLRPVATVEAQGADDAETAVTSALRAHRGVKGVLCWDDTTAVGAARALDGRGGFVGGLALAGVTDPTTLDALHAGNPLRCVVAPRLRDLARQLVDVPFALSHGHRRTRSTVPVRALMPATDLADYRADY